MSDINQFVSELVIHNEIATSEQVDKARKMLKLKPGKTVLDLLISGGAIDEAYRDDILAMWEEAREEYEAAAVEPEPEVPDEEEEPPAGIRVQSSAVNPIEVVQPPNPGDIPPPGELTTLHDYLLYAREIGASDLHISVNVQPHYRMHGNLYALNDTVLTAEDTERLLFEDLTPEQRAALEKDQGIEYCMKKEEGRYRTSVVQQRTGYDGAFRVVDNRVKTLEELGLPDSLRRLTEYHQGLVLVGGPNGCGKSSTMAALVELVNQNRQEHIITVEDPIEAVFSSAACQINQREAGTHTRSFANALKAALREDPDIIMIGELRDRETISLAITAAETGHLVFGTLHTTSSARTIDRLLDVFPPGEQAQVRSMISESIKGIICQQLVARADGVGRVLALEILFNNAACGSLIRERKLHQMPSVMQMGRAQGMRLLDNSLEELLEAGVITGEEAYSAADNKDLFDQYAPDFIS